MPAAYDNYDYPSYWEGRDYEHQAEVIAIKSFIQKIDDIKTIIDLGAGYGRLAPYYSFRANKVILTDSSAKLLKTARKNLKDKKYKFIQSKIENLPPKVKKNTADLAIIVRVVHHIENLDGVFDVLNKVIKPNGHLILEFANKRHLKATILEFLKGNFTFPLEIFPKDIRSKSTKKKKTLPFINYHPDIIKEKIKESGFEILETRSVSNIRSPFCKNLIPKEVLLFLEEKLQKPLSSINFGPSVFVLARKRG